MKAVASRRLRKTYAEKANINLDQEEKVNYSLEIRMILSSLLVICAFLGKTYFPEQIKSNKYLKMVYNEYKKDYHLDKILEKTVKDIKSMYVK